MMDYNILERMGGAPNLTQIFSKFCEQRLQGVSLDTCLSSKSEGELTPDFSCLRGLLLMEFKQLETSQSSRIANVLRQTISNSEYPHFLGDVSLNHILNRISNPAEVTRSIRSKLRRTISSHLNKASKQLAFYRKQYPRQNCVDICVLFNSEIEIFEPMLVAKIIQNIMLTENYSYNLNAVLYISEKHFTMLPDGTPSFSIIIVENDCRPLPSWKSEILSLVATRWSQYRTGTNAKWLQPTEMFFRRIDDVQAAMPRHKLWRRSYKHDPYLRNFDLRALKIIFMMVNIEIMLAVLKGDWERPPKEKTAECFEIFTHINEELNHRGLTMDQYSHRTLSIKEREKFIRPGVPNVIREIILEP